MNTEEVLSLSVSDILDAYHENENHQAEAEAKFDEVNGRVTLLKTRVDAIDKLFPSKPSDLHQEIDIARARLDAYGGDIARLKIASPRDPHSFFGRIRWLFTGN